LINWFEHWVEHTSLKLEGWVQKLEHANDL